MTEGGHPSPDLAAPKESGENELEAAFFAGETGDDLGALTLLDEDSLKQVCGANEARMASWEAQVGKAGLKVVEKASDGLGIDDAVLRRERLDELPGNLVVVSIEGRPELRQQPL